MKKGLPVGVVLAALSMGIFAGCAANQKPQHKIANFPPVRVYFGLPPHAERKGNFTASCFASGRLIPGERLNEQLAEKAAQMGGNAVVLAYIDITGESNHNESMTLQGLVVELPQDRLPAPQTYFVSPEHSTRKGFFTFAVFGSNGFYSEAELERLLAEKEKKFGANAEMITMMSFVGIAGENPLIKIEAVALNVPEE